MDPKLQTQVIRGAAWLVLILSLLLIVPVSVFTAAPGECVSCHDDQDAAMLPSGSPHEGIECASCHVGTSVTARVRFAYYQAFGMQVRLVPTHDTWISTVRDNECTACHDDLRGVTESRGLRVIHDVCAEGSTCVSCHSTSAHLDSIAWPTTYAMERCLSCHGIREVSQDCESCHLGRLDRDIPTTGTFAVTHGPNWQQTHGMGEMPTCAACHRVDEFCTPCHGPGVPHSPRFVNVHGDVSRDRDAQCFDCHQTSFCDDCHVYEMPHPESFVPEHSAIVDRDGEQGCVACHERVDCVTCHELHVHPGGSGSLPALRGGRPQ